MALYDFQREFVRGIYDRIREGEKTIACVSPTGSGKTVCLTKIVADAISRGRRVLICVDINVLVSQTLDKFEQWDSWEREASIAHLERSLNGSNDLEFPPLPSAPQELTFKTGIIQGRTNENRNLPIQIASLQSLSKDRRTWAREFPWDLIILDEAHVTGWRKVARELFDRSRQNGSIILGFTATPYRLSKRQSFADLFGSLVYSRTPAELQKMGFLAPMRYFSFPQLDLSSVRITAGDYNKDDLAIAVNKVELIEHIYRQWMLLTPGKSTLAFCVSVDHAHAVADYFNSRGVRSAVVTGKTPMSDRKILYQQIKSGELTLLASVNVISTGFDAPNVEVGLGLRPTKSLALFHQQIGRIMRVFKGKTCGYWLDQAGNLSRAELMLPESIPGYDLSERSASKEGVGEAPYRFCEPDKTVSGDGCGSRNHASAKICQHCGREFLKKEAVTITSDFVEIYTEPPSGNPRKDYYRDQLRACYRRGWNPNRALHELQTRYRDCYASGSWGIGAVFGDSPTTKHYEAYYQYLRKVAKRATAGDSTIESTIAAWFPLEFHGEDAQAWLIEKLYAPSA